jgi:hypothetical protein
MGSEGVFVRSTGKFTLIREEKAANKQVLAQVQGFSTKEAAPLYPESLRIQGSFPVNR